MSFRCHLLAFAFCGSLSIRPGGNAVQDITKQLSGYLKRIPYVAASTQAIPVPAADDFSSFDGYTSVPRFPVGLMRNASRSSKE
jgi:hypothetical protein